MSQGSVSGRGYFIAAVADGHGDSRHDLSDIGAALAVQIATQQLLVMRGVNPEEGEQRLRRSFQDDCGRLIARRWREAVADDLRSREDQPLPPEDLVRQSVRYGSTLLAALVTDASIHVGQLGDGDIVWVRADGRIERPFYVDEPSIGTETESLCSRDAALRWQAVSLERSGGGTLFLTSDGVAGSFATDTAFEGFLRDRAQQGLECGPAEIASRLPVWLDELSARGSGDDITLAMVQLPAAEPAH